MRKTKKPKLEAQLIMESYGHAPSVRFRNLKPVAVWSKLYRADDYYLDISLQKSQDILQLSGKVLAVDETFSLKGNIRLYEDEHLLSEMTLPDDADFSLVLNHHGIYQLECELSDLILEVANLEIS